MTGEPRPFRRVVLVGNFGPPVLAFARSCKQLGVSTSLLEITAARRIGWRPSSALESVSTLSPTLMGTTEGIGSIHHHASVVDADAIIAVSERLLLWLARHRAEFAPRCELLCPSLACLSRLASKQRQIEAAIASGFSVLPTWYLRDPADAARVPAERFPLCLRPSEPEKVSPTFKALVVHSRSELEERMAALTSIVEPVIAQSFLRLPDLKVHGMRAATGTRTVFRPFFVERKFQGVTLTLQRATFPPGLEAACARFAEHVDLTGAFHFDLLYSPVEQRAYFLEVNARMGGITDKAARFGYDQPRLILEAFGHPTRDGDGRGETSRRRVVTKRAVCRHIASALSGQLTELDYPQVGTVRHILLSLRDLMFARDSVFDRHDMRGTIWFNLQGAGG